MSVEFQFSSFGQTDRRETQTVVASKEIEKKYSNKLVCLQDFFLLRAIVELLTTCFLGK